MLDRATQREPLRIFTWHIHGSYLYYLSQAPCQFIVPVRKPATPGYTGRSGPFAWGDNVIEVPVEEVANTEFDCILFQHRKNYVEDQYDVLSDRQRDLPKIYLEHDPPRETPTETRHVVDDPETPVVHVTHFNNLMWNCGRSPTQVIEHAVLVPEDARYTGELSRGIVVINNIHLRGRRLGLDVLEEVRRQVPLDLVGMGSREAGGLGEVPPPELPRFIAKYRFFFNPIRYTSLGLAVCEAMTVGMPMIGLATTEMPVTVENGVSGYVHTDVDYLVGRMKQLLTDREHATRLSRGAASAARRKFGIERFAMQWHDLFLSRVSGNQPRQRILGAQ